MYENLFKTISDHTIILTPNRRLSATLQKLYAIYQADKNFWFTPNFLPLSTWIQSLWQTYHDKQFSNPPLLLSPIQELALWEKIVSTHEHLLQINETAELIASAWNLLKQWNLDYHDKSFSSTSDYSTLQNWFAEFETTCTSKHYIDNASLIDRIINQLAEFDISSHIVLVGFTELTPQLKNLFARCTQNGTRIEEYVDPKELCAPRYLSFPDEESELYTMANWAKDLHQRQPQASIACIVPSLEQNRPRVVQVFAEIFSAHNTYQTDVNTSAVNISSGKALAKYPIIYTALQLLNLNQAAMTVEKFSYLLLSPFLGEGEAEFQSRAIFDAHLKAMNIHSIDLKRLLNKRDDLSAKFCLLCPKFFTRLAEFHTTINEDNGNTYSARATQINNLLTIMGWPGERSINSEEYQVVQSWYDLLATFTSLGQLNSEVSFAKALSKLNHLANKTIFQPQSPEANIQVLGVLEAAAIPFDYIWMMGLDDMSWPPPPNPNPFIPKLLQRELNMPHATANRELAFCNTLIYQFQQAAAQLLFSYSEQKEQLDLNPSSLIRHYPLILLQDLALPSFSKFADRIYANKIIETVIDDQAPALGENEIVKGGVSVLKQQALCPFKSFAEWRLNAREIETTLPGLRSKDRGSILHKALELIWNELQTQHNLLAQSTAALHELIANKIDSALTTPANTRKDKVRYTHLEKKRLHRLIFDWLELEKKRPPFRVIMNESSIQITLDRLTLTTRADRIDELEDGRKLIIDYKTGKNNEISSWFSSRPDEPQLPMYSLVDPDNTIGITFAQLSAGNHCFKGVSSYDINIKGLRKVSDLKKLSAQTWEEQLSEWKTHLHILSNDFSNGLAHVNPKHAEQTCQWCALKPLCRIYDN